MQRTFSAWRLMAANQALHLPRWAETNPHRSIVRQAGRQARQDACIIVQLFSRQRIRFFLFSVTLRGLVNDRDKALRY